MVEPSKCVVRTTWRAFYQSYWLLADPRARERMGQSAAEFAAANQETLTKNLSLANRYL